MKNVQRNSPKLSVPDHQKEGLDRKLEQIRVEMTQEAQRFGDLEAKKVEKLYSEKLKVLEERNLDLEGSFLTMRLITDFRQKPPSRWKASNERRISQKGCQRNQV